MQLPTVLPKAVWRALRQVCVAAALAVAALLVLEPAIGLPLFWGLIIPALPLVFMFMPGLWRNLCPLAASNQTPRLHKFRGRDRSSTGHRLPDRHAAVHRWCGRPPLLFNAAASPRRP